MPNCARLCILKSLVYNLPSFMHSSILLFNNLKIFIQNQYPRPQCTSIPRLLPSWNLYSKERVEEEFERQKTNTTISESNKTHEENKIQCQVKGEFKSNVVNNNGQNQTIFWTNLVLASLKKKMRWKFKDTRRQRPVKEFSLFLMQDNIQISLRQLSTLCPGASYTKWLLPPGPQTKVTHLAAGAPRHALLTASELGLNQPQSGVESAGRYGFLTSFKALRIKSLSVFQIETLEDWAASFQMKRNFSQEFYRNITLFSCCNMTNVSGGKEHSDLGITFLIVTIY